MLRHANLCPECPSPSAKIIKHAVEPRQCDCLLKRRKKLDTLIWDMLVIIGGLSLAILVAALLEFSERFNEKNKKKKLMVGLETLIKTAKKSAHKLNKQIIVWRQDYVSAIDKCMQRYYNVLETKYFQLVFVDDYGKLQLLDFHKELSRFSQKVVFEDEIQHKYRQIIKGIIEHSAFDDVFSLWTYMTKSGLCWNDVGQLWPAYKSDLRYVSDAGLVFAAEIARQWLPPMDRHISLEDATPENGSFERLNESIFDYRGYNENTEFVLESNARRLCFDIVYAFFDITFRNVQHKTNRPETIKQGRPGKETPQQYEIKIATELRNLGFVARTTKASGDQGADVLASKNGMSFAIQCKMYSKPVGNKAVQEANAGRDFYKKDYGVVVSNAGFTKSARQAANACGIILLNDNQLEDLLKYTNS